MTHSSHLVDAEITLQFSDTKKYEIIQIEGIICKWVWAEGTRENAEYAGVCNWVSKVFGDSINGFIINNLVSSKALA
jgi:hypothetical protein